jgi:hypothetical protein
LQTV